MFSSRFNSYQLFLLEQTCHLCEFLFFVCIHITGSNPFEQYQQRQQEAYQGLQSFFEQQRYMQQQHHILQSLNQCYSQLQQQHQDMAVLQQQFQQLFSYNPSSALSENYPSPQRPFTASPNLANTSPMFMNLPFQSPQQPPFSAPVNSQASFSNAYQPPSSAPEFRTAWHPTTGPVSCLNLHTEKLEKALFGIDMLSCSLLCRRFRLERESFCSRIRHVKFYKKNKESWQPHPKGCCFLHPQSCLVINVGHGIDRATIFLLLLFFFSSFDKD